jgi:hypothetical protein
MGNSGAGEAGLGQPVEDLAAGLGAPDAPDAVDGHGHTVVHEPREDLLASEHGTPEEAGPGLEVIVDHAGHAVAAHRCQEVEQDLGVTTTAVDNDRWVWREHPPTIGLHN